MKKERYVIIDTRQTCGNSVFFWCWDSRGYTLDLRCAAIFDDEEAKKICANRDTDKMVKYSEIVRLVQHHVDIQDLGRGKDGIYKPRSHPHTLDHLQVSK